MQLDDVSKRIKQSAKLRLDWFEFENIFIEFFGTDNGTQKAEDILFNVLGELSLGKKKDEVTQELIIGFLMSGLSIDLGTFVASVEQKCKAEIQAMSHCRELNTIGLPIEEIYTGYLKPNLLSLSKPSIDEQQFITGVP